MNGEINWGPEIAVEGKRPEWLDSGTYRVNDSAIEYEGAKSDCYAWSFVNSIRLPANHPHYRTEATMVDWSRPIEAVHRDGRVVAVRLDPDYEGKPNDEGDYVLSNTALGSRLFKADGTARTPAGLPWTIRNTPQATETPRTAPNGGEVVPEVVEHLVQYIRGMAAQYDAGNHDIDYAYAKDLVALLPELVDPDEAYADDLLKQQGWDGAIDIGFAAVSRMIANAHRDGRSLSAPQPGCPHVWGEWQGAQDYRQRECLKCHAKQFKSGRALAGERP